MKKMRYTDENKKIDEIAQSLLPDGSFISCEICDRNNHIVFISIQNEIDINFGLLDMLKTALEKEFKHSNVHIALNLYVTIVCINNI